MQRVVVANPGGQAHLKEAASAFADAGELHAYISTFGFGPRDIERLRRRLPSGVGSRIERELRRRAVSAEVGARSVRVATRWEVANVLLMRTTLPSRFKYAAWRSTREAFDRHVSMALGPDVDAVLGYQGATVETFRRARELGVASVLDYPIAHYAVAEALIAEEVRLVPEYASTMSIFQYPDWLRERYKLELELADRVIMVSEHHQQTFAEAGIEPARTFIVPWYVDCDLFSPGRVRERQDDDVFRVGFVGQITQRKGISYLVEGFQRAGLDNAELVMIGHPFGTERPWLKPGVRHVPAMPRYELPNALRRCHVIVMPSLVEGFPISVLEGMACGLPAIISENIGRDVVEDGTDGFVVPIRDPDAIAERLRKLHADTDLRRRMSIAARAKAEQFTLDRYRENLRSGVSSLLAERAAA